MATALYRRYRPDDFADMIGQSQVTEPLMTALRTGRVNHAYLFSGPRGCGKTSSARILARCLNCAEGPTDKPCGVCPSCVELSTGGPGSLDVVEIDAASHGGVDDARDLRERALLAPSRDRYKVFIIDEAHMVTAAGFNALLKVVEEPPEHVRFVFATTEPEKVIGTIRSRTHHYPFRLIAPALMLEYVEGLCSSEHVRVDAGVLPLVVRAGGGSARDTLSLLDQIIAGSEDAHVRYDRAAALLGFTDQALLDATVDAFADADADAAYRAVDGVVQSGQDPRRFVEDLLERLRDLIIARATGAGAGAVLRGMSPDDVDRLVQQSKRFTPAALTGIADLVNETLTELSGVTSPRLHLELLAARVLVASRSTFESTSFDEPGEDAAPAARPTGGGQAAAAAPASAPAAGAASVAPAAPPAAPSSAPSAAAPAQRPVPPAPNPASSLGSAPDPGPDRRPAESGASTPPRPASGAPSAASTAPSGQTAPVAPPASTAAAGRPVSDVAAAAAAEWGAAPVPSTPARGDSRLGARVAASNPSTPAGPASSAEQAGSGPVTFARFRDAWPTILERIRELGGMPAWTVAQSIRPRDYRDGILLFEVPGRAVLDQFKTSVNGAPAPHEIVREAVRAVLGVTIKFQPRVLNVPDAPQAVRPAGEPQPPRRQADGPGSAWPEVATPAAAPGADGRDAGGGAPGPATGAPAEAGLEAPAAPAEAPAPTPAEEDAAPTAAAAPDEQAAADEYAAGAGAGEPNAGAAAEEALERVATAAPSPDGAGADQPVPAGDEPDGAVAHPAASTPVAAARTRAPERDPWAPADAEPGPAVAAEPAGAEAPSERAAAEPPAASPESAPAATGPADDLPPEPEPEPESESESASASADAPARKPVPDLFAAARSLGAAPVDTAALAREAEERRVAEERAEQAAREAAERASQRTFADGIQRYGEAVVRELLGARFIGEDAVEEAPVSGYAAAAAGEANGDSGYPSDDEAPPSDDVPPDYYGAPPPPESEGY